MPGGLASTGAGTLPESNCFVQVVQVCELEPGTEYRVQGSDGGSAFFYTLPDQLPTESEPFSLFLGSCFFQGSDEEGRVGNRFRNLPVDSRPQIKVMTGDQVYLDTFLGSGLPILSIVSKGDYARHSLKKYRRTWSDPSFQSLLRRGGAFLTADDHEFWNNSPNWQPHLPGTWKRSGRDAWRQVALSLFEDFQGDAPLNAGSPKRFRIGRLSFFVVDTRVDREPGDDVFMRPSDFDRLARWLSESSDPGVLAISQPIFQGASGRFKKRLDRTLANYAQYG